MSVCKIPRGCASCQRHACHNAFKHAGPTLRTPLGFECGFGLSSWQLPVPVHGCKVANKSQEMHVRPRIVFVVVEGKCASWCASNKQAWATKCSWKSGCSSCSQCGGKRCLLHLQSTVQTVTNTCHDGIFPDVFFCSSLMNLYDCKPHTRARRFCNNKCTSSYLFKLVLCQ